MYRTSRTLFIWSCVGSVRFTPYMCVCMSLVQFPSVLFVSAHLFPQHPSHRSSGVVFYLCACQCAMSTLLCIRGRVFPHSTHLCVSLPSSAFSPLFFFCHMFVQIFFFFFFSASATCVVAMFLCLYISEHLLFQQGPHGLKCQSKQLPDKCIVQQACVSPPPIPPLLVL